MFLLLINHSKIILPLETMAVGMAHYFPKCMIPMSQCMLSTWYLCTWYLYLSHVSRYMISISEELSPRDISLEEICPSAYSAASGFLCLLFSLDLQVLCICWHRMLSHCFGVGGGSNCIIRRTRPLYTVHVQRFWRHRRRRTCCSRRRFAYWTFTRAQTVYSFI